MPWRKERITKFLSEHFKETKNNTFEFDVNGYTGTFEFLHRSPLSQVPYREWLSVSIVLPGDWPKQKNDRITFFCENKKVGDVIYLTSTFYEPIKPNKITDFLKLQTDEINRRI